MITKSDLTEIELAFININSIEFIKSLIIIMIMIIIFLIVF